MNPYRDKGPQRHCNGCRCGELQAHSQYLAGQPSQMADNDEDKNIGTTANYLPTGALNSPNEY